MKKIKAIITSIIILILLGSCVSLEYTDPALLEDPFIYIQEIEGKTKDELYSLSRLWIAETYNSAEAVITFEDKETGVIRGTGIGNFYVKENILKPNWEFSYNLSISVKDNKVKLEFLNIKSTEYYKGYNYTISLEHKMVFDAINEYFKSLNESYLESITSSKVDNDW